PTARTVKACRRSSRLTSGWLRSPATEDAAAGGAGRACVGASLGTAVVRETRAPQTTRLLLPRPRPRSFHFTFFASLHSSGGRALGASPVAAGPRHAGQKRSRPVGVAPSPAAAAKTARRARTNDGRMHPPEGPPAREGLV